VLHSTEFFLALAWSADGQPFTDSFRILSLKSYDGIVGHDWLAKHSPIITHWSQHWLSIVHDDKLVVLHGEGAPEVTHALLELFLVQDPVSTIISIRTLMSRISLTRFRLSLQVLLVCRQGDNMITLFLSLLGRVPCPCVPIALRQN
jgi:hypothetical protein